MKTTAPLVNSKHNSKPCKVSKCNYNHAMQDKMNGIQNRAKNPSAKGYKCTVCIKIEAYQ